MRASFDIPPEPRETAMESLVTSGYRLFYLFKLCGAVALVYIVARAAFG